MRPCNRDHRPGAARRRTRRDTTPRSEGCGRFDLLPSGLLPSAPASHRICLTIRTTLAGWRRYCALPPVGNYTLPRRSIVLWNRAIFLLRADTKPVAVAQAVGVAPFHTHNNNSQSPDSPRGGRTSGARHRLGAGLGSRRQSAFEIFADPHAKRHRRSQADAGHAARRRPGGPAPPASASHGCAPARASRTAPSLSSHS